ncbi:MAG: MerR family transcriptional regulator [Proteobacteria bacterium]|nr:MerR family transcriptional regulator [Pseudomonadota bacterium]MCG2766453.1 MerR family transcriptional regulator [Desulfarculaceae bacterium]
MSISKPIQIGWGTEALAEKVGVSQRQIRYWREKGLLEARLSKGSSRQGGFVFDMKDLVVALAIKELKNKGVSFYRIRKSVERIKKLFNLEHPLAEMNFACLAHSIVFKKGDYFIESITGQQVFDVVLEKVEKGLGKKHYVASMKELKNANQIISSYFEVG